MRGELIITAYNAYVMHNIRQYPQNNNIIMPKWHLQFNDLGSGCLKSIIVGSNLGIKKIPRQTRDSLFCKIRSQIHFLSFVVETETDVGTGTGGESTVLLLYKLIIHMAEKI